MDDAIYIDFFLFTFQFLWIRSFLISKILKYGSENLGNQFLLPELYSNGPFLLKVLL